jgi:hypothetical protein
VHDELGETRAGPRAASGHAFALFVFGCEKKLPEASRVTVERYELGFNCMV